MKFTCTHFRKHTTWQAAVLALTFLAALALSTIQPIIHAHAQDCMDCSGGGDPGPIPIEPPDPGKDPGGDPGDPHEPPGRPKPPERPPCQMYFDPPTISASLTLDPVYPITLGQDPDDRGVDVRGITALGGARHCPEGGSGRIVSFSVLKVQLARSSVAWINSALANKYPGAHVKGNYPFTPAFRASGIGSGQAQLSFHLAPLDPGYYEVTVQVTQEDGQSASSVLRVPVYLMESAIIE